MKEAEGRVGGREKLEEEGVGDGGRCVSTVHQLGGRGHCTLTCSYWRLHGHAGRSPARNADAEMSGGLGHMPRMRLRGRAQLPNTPRPSTMRETGMLAKQT